MRVSSRNSLTKKTVKCNIPIGFWGKAFLPAPSFLKSTQVFISQQGVKWLIKKISYFSGGAVINTPGAEVKCLSGIQSIRGNTFWWGAVFPPVSRDILMHDAAKYHIAGAFFNDCRRYTSPYVFGWFAASGPSHVAPGSLWNLLNL